MVQFSASIDEKGQFTLPEELRDRLGLTEGDTLVFESRGARIVARKAPASGNVHSELAERIARRFSDMGVTPAEVRATMGWTGNKAVEVG
jgi:AbrB family looped-hinge helix DNA binding protein